MAIYLGYDRVGIIKTVKVKVFANTTTVSGTYSVVLNNSIGDEVDQLIIEGNSVQSGTPTHASPVEIKSVGDLGKNLCGGRNVLVNKLIGNSANGIIVDSTVYNTMYIEVQEGQTYSFTGFVRADGSSLKGCFYDSNGDWVSAFEETTVTIPTGVKYVGRSFNNTVEQVQFEVGQPTEYEPYGYRIPVISKGKNLFDINNIEEGSILTLSGEDYNIPNRYRLKYTFMKAGTYTLAINGNVQGGGYLHKYSAPNAESWINTVPFSTMKTVNGRNIRTATLDQDCYVRFVFLPIGDQTLSKKYLLENKPQLELSSTVTEYEPYYTPQKYNIYLNEPLRKIGEFADILDYKNKKVIRKIASEYLDTVTTMSGDATTYRKFLTDIKYKPYLAYQSGFPQQNNYSIGYAISNKFKQSSYYYGLLGNNPNFIQTYITTSGITRCVYTFDDKSIQSTAKAQELIGDGFEICYVTDQEREEKIEFPMILTRDVETRFEVDTEIEPTKLEVSYWEEIK